MKKLLFAASVLAVLAAVPEKSPYTFYFDAPNNYTVRIYTNGVAWRSFLPSEYTLAGATNGVNTWKLATTAPDVAGRYDFTATMLFNGQESDPSNIHPENVKPNKLGNFYGKEK